jgi:hypothetical protein
LKVGCGDKCSPTPAWQVNFSTKSMWYDQTCGEVQRCDRSGIGPCLRDCLANGTDGTDCTTRKFGNSVQLKTHTCELTSGPEWYKCVPITCENQPCGEHGNCTNGIGSFSCDCDTGWTGDTCDQDIDHVPDFLSTSPLVVSLPSVVHVNYGYQQVVACQGTTVSVEWNGTHNIQEVVSSNCSSVTIGEPIVGFKNSGHTQAFNENELSASPGSTRFFKCDSHCGASSARFEVSCPLNSLV